MAYIVNVHHPHVEQMLIDEAIVKFYWIRDLHDLRKPPSTSELVDWIGALTRGGIDIDSITSRIPYLGTLLKKERDLETFSRANKRKRR